MYITYAILKKGGEIGQLNLASRETQMELLMPCHWAVWVCSLCVTFRIPTKLARGSIPGHVGGQHGDDGLHCSCDIGVDLFGTVVHAHRTQGRDGDTQIRTRRLSIFNRKITPLTDWLHAAWNLKMTVNENPVEESAKDSWKKNVTMFLNHSTKARDSIQQ